MMGVNSGDGRGNITAFATVFDSEQVLQGDRDYSACSLSANTVDHFRCGGSATSAGGLFTDFTTYYFTVDTPTAWRDFDFGADLYNFGPLNHYQRPERRYSLGAMGHYEFNEHADVYTQLMFNDYQSIAQIAPSGDFFETSTINCDNPFLPVANLASDRLRSSGSRRRHRRPVVHRAPQRRRRRPPAVVLQQLVSRGRGRPRLDQRGLGLRRVGAVLEGRANTSTLNYFVTPRVVRALDVHLVGGVPTCQSVIDQTDLACVPWNPFQPGGITPEALAYLQASGLQIAHTTQEIYNGVINGDLGTYGIKSPLASDGIQVVFGAEYRRDTLDNTVDALQEQRLAGRLGRADDRHQRRHEGE